VINESTSKPDTENTQKPKKKYYRRPYKRYNNHKKSGLKKLSFKKVSILVPLYNEEESLKPLIAEISNALKTIDINYEIMFVDDGSTDRSLKIIISIC